MEPAEYKSPTRQYMQHWPYFRLPVNKLAIFGGRNCCRAHNDK
jgi:hypothetical protein